jgi:uncharacterized membrane protein YkvA (DUF1232 family)
MKTGREGGVPGGSELAVRSTAGSKISTMRIARSLAELIETWKRWARKLKIEVYALYLAYKDPRVPLYARIFAACVVGYAFSPIDLIPDPIPVFGYLDDLVLIPLGVLLAIKMIPPNVLDECRENSREVIQQGKPVNRAAAAVIIAVWLLLATLAVVLIVQIARK